MPWVSPLVRQPELTPDAVRARLPSSRSVPREDLDYLVALHGAKRDPEWLTQFYHMCRVRALDLDVDIGDEADNGLEDPGIPGDPDPPKPYDYR